MRDRTEASDEATLHNLIEAMRLEVARELNYSGVEEGQCGHWTSAQSGRFGATLYKRAKAVLSAEATQTPVSRARAGTCAEKRAEQARPNAPKNQHTPENRREGIRHAKS